MAKLPPGISRRKNGTYMWRVMYDYKRYTGYAEKLEDAKKALNEKRYELEHGIAVKDTNMTVGEWFETWIAQYKAVSVKRGTIETYRKIYKNHVKDSIGRKKLQDVRPEHIQAFYNETAKNCGQDTIDLTAIVTGGMFKQAYKNRLIKMNPAELTTRPKKRKEKKISVMSKEEQDIFLSYAKDSPFYNAYAVALCTGMRCGEIRALEWSDIDTDVIHVNGTLKFEKGKGYYKDIPKTGSSRRDIPILPAVKEIFTEEKRKRLQSGCQSDYVFTYKNGVIRTDLLNIEMRKILSRIRENYPDFVNVTPHTLRHTFATRSLEGGMPPKVLQTILGHASITMTLDIYTHVMPNTKAEEMKKVADLLV